MSHYPPDAAERETSGFWQRATRNAAWKEEFEINFRGAECWKDYSALQTSTGSVRGAPWERYLNARAHCRASSQQQSLFWRRIWKQFCFIFLHFCSSPKNVSWSTDFSKTNASRSQDSDYVRLEFTFDRPERERERLVWASRGPWRNRCVWGIADGNTRAQHWTVCDWEVHPEFCVCGWNKIANKCFRRSVAKHVILYFSVLSSLLGMLARLMSGWDCHCVSTLQTKDTETQCLEMTSSSTWVSFYEFTDVKFLTNVSPWKGLSWRDKSLFMFLASYFYYLAYFSS